jgi:hypothetical protein
MRRADTAEFVYSAEFLIELVEVNGPVIYGISIPGA